MIRELKADGLWLCRPAPPSAKGRVQEPWGAMEDGACKAWGDMCQGAGDWAGSYSYLRTGISMFKSFSSFYHTDSFLTFVNCSLIINEQLMTLDLNKGYHRIKILCHSCICFATEPKREKVFFPHQLAHSSSARWHMGCPQNRRYVLFWAYFGAVLGDTHAELCKTWNLRNEKLFLATNTGCNEKFTPY